MVFLSGWFSLVTALLAVLAMPTVLQAGERELADAYPYRADEIASLRAGFADPPSEAGPWVYWIWFDNVASRVEVSRQIREMAAAGIAGAELRFVVADGFPDLHAPWFAPEGWEKLVKSE